MRPWHVRYKTPHNLFFRRIWRVVDAFLESTEFGHESYVFITKGGRRFEVPTEGTVFIFGKRHNIK